jgi:hypothetical protein
MLLSLGGMFLALGMVILAVGVGGSAMRLRCGFVMFRRLVVFVFHGVSSLLAEGMSAPEHMVPLRSIHNQAMVVEQIKVREGNSVKLSLLWNFSVKCPYFHCCSV